MLKLVDTDRFVCKCCSVGWRNNHIYVLITYGEIDLEDKNFVFYLPDSYPFKRSIDEFLLQFFPDHEIHVIDFAIYLVSDNAEYFKKLFNYFHIPLELLEK